MQTRAFIVASCVVVAATISGSSIAAEDYLADGYPKNIPAPGSKPPTVAEWDAVPREVNVKNSTSYHCETKMLREWLRVSCRPYDKWTLKRVATLSDEGQQAYVGIFGERASCVVQVVKNKKYVARYTWNDNSTRDLTVDWTGRARPIVFFN